MTDFLGRLALALGVGAACCLLGAWSGAPNGSGAPPLRLAQQMDGDDHAALETSGRPDRDMARVLSALERLGPKPIETLSPEQARTQPTLADAARTLLSNETARNAAHPSIQTREIMLPGPAGEIPARIYTPEGEPPFPVVVYFHDGGWVIGDLDAGDASARAIAREAEAIVLSAHYRQGPEHKFPAAHEDAFAAFEWALAHARVIGGDPSRVATAGEGAGGNLAINVSVAARNQGSPLPIHQALISPLAGSDTNTPSYVRRAQAKPLGKAAMEWLFAQAFGADDARNPMINLLEADLRGLPTTTIVTAEIDPLNWEGVALSERLRTAGVGVTARDYPGVTHGFFGLGALVADAKNAQDFVGRELRQAFANGDATSAIRDGAR